MVYMCLANANGDIRSVVRFTASAVRQVILWLVHSIRYAQSLQWDFLC